MYTYYIVHIIKNEIIDLTNDDDQSNINKRTSSDQNLYQQEVNNNLHTYFYQKEFYYRFEKRS